MMLDGIRNNAQSWGVKIAFGIIILVFVFWGVGSYTGPKGLVATVNGKKIPLSEIAYDLPQKPQGSVADQCALLEQRTREALNNAVYDAEREALAATFPTVQAGAELLIRGDLAGAQQRCNGVGAC